MGLFSGKRPPGLGVTNGVFKPCSWKPNCVNSTADAVTDAAHYIAPFKFSGAAAGAWANAVNAVKSGQRVTVVTETSTYLYAEYASRTLGYIDDVELFLDAVAGLIQIRSASRLGVRDFGVNRARAEALRAALAADATHPAN